MKKRIEYLDHLRILAILSIILLHCISIFRYEYYGNDSLSFFAMTFLDAFTRFGVPAFFMLTGALMIPKKEEPYKEFLIKRVGKLLLAYLFFSGVYYLYKGNTSIFEFVRQVTSFRTEYHLWFMPVMILIYIFLPFIKKLVESLSKEELKKMITIIFILGNGCIAINAITALFGYPLLSSFTLPNLLIYTNYVFLGYYLSKEDCKISKKLVIFTILSLLCIPVATYLISKTEIIDTFLDAISPFVIAPSIFVFLWFKKKKSKSHKWISSISKTSLYIYLIHVLPLSILSKKFISQIHTKGFIYDLFLLLVLFVVTAITSILFAFVWTKLKEWIKKHQETISKYCIHILLGFMGIITGIILLSIFINPYHILKMNFLFLILMIGIWIGLFYCFLKYQDKIENHKWISYIGIILFLCLQGFIIYCFQVNPSWDFGRIFDNAIEFAKSANPTFGNEYLYVCSNNIIISVFFDCVFKFATMLGFKNYLLLGILINVFAVDISLYFLYKLLKCMNPKDSKWFIGFCMIFSPLLFYLPIFYTDTLSLPFIIIPLYFLYKYFFINPKIHYIMVSGSLMGIGGMIKPTVLIPTIAVFIFLILKNHENRWKVGIILLGCISLFVVGQKIFINHFFDQDALEQYQIPTSHFIWIGLQGNGGYSEESYKKINQVLGQEERNKIAIHGIKTRMKELWKKKQIGSFYYKKLNYTWTDGTFYAGEKLRRKPIHEEYTKYVYSEKDNWLYWTVSTSEWILVLVGMLLGIIFRKHLPKELQDFQTILWISIFGIFLFLLIWETRSRYLVNFVPVFLANAYIGVCAMKNKMDRRIKK